MDLPPASPTLLPNPLGLDGHDLVEQKKASRGPPKFFRATRELVFDAPVNLGRGSRTSRTVRKQRFKKTPRGFEQRHLSGVKRGPLAAHDGPTSPLSKHAMKGTKKTLHHLLTREITHASMFMKALEQMGKLDDPFFGNIPPDETVKLVFNLSQGGRTGPLERRARLRVCRESQA
jgi:hypothetical protein